MDNLFKEVQERLVELDEMFDEQQKEAENKVFTVRLPLDLIKQLADIATVLQTTKTDVARMILSHGAESIIEKFKIKVDSHGMSFEDMYALETGEKVFVDEDGKEADLADTNSLEGKTFRLVNKELLKDE